MGTGSGGGSDAGGMMVGCEGSKLWFLGSLKVNLRETYTGTGFFVNWPVYRPLSKSGSEHPKDRVYTIWGCEQLQYPCSRFFRFDPYPWSISLAKQRAASKAIGYFVTRIHWSDKGSQTDVRPKPKLLISFTCIHQLKVLTLQYITYFGYHTPMSGSTCTKPTDTSPISVL